MTTLCPLLLLLLFTATAASVVQLKFPLASSNQCNFRINQNGTLNTIPKYTWAAPLDRCGIVVPDDCGTSGAVLNLTMIMPSESNWESFWYMRFGSDVCTISSVGGARFVSWRNQFYPIQNSNQFNFAWDAALSQMTINELVLSWTYSADKECRVGPYASPGTKLLSINNYRHTDLAERITYTSKFMCFIETLYGYPFSFGDWQVTASDSIITKTIDSVFWPPTPQGDTETATLTIEGCFSGDQFCATTINCPSINPLCVLDLRDYTCVPQS